MSKVAPQLPGKVGSTSAARCGDVTPPQRPLFEFFWPDALRYRLLPSQLAGISSSFASRPMLSFHLRTLFGLRAFDSHIHLRTRSSFATLLLSPPPSLAGQKWCAFITTEKLADFPAFFSTLCLCGVIVVHVKRLRCTP